MDVLDTDYYEYTDMEEYVLIVFLEGRSHPLPLTLP